MGVQVIKEDEEQNVQSHRMWGRSSSDTLNVNEAFAHLRASGGSLVPDTLMELRDMALLKKCLNDGGTSLPFLQKQRERAGNKVMWI